MIARDIWVAQVCNYSTRLLNVAAFFRHFFPESRVELFFLQPGSSG